MGGGEVVALTAEYGPRAGDRWRWVADPADDVVGAFVAGLLRLDPTEFARVRASLSVKDRNTLLMYAQRSAFAALRGEDPALVRRSVAAMSLVTEEAVVDERVIWTVAGLRGHALHRLGGIDRAAIDVLLVGADETVRSALSSTLDDGSDLLFDSGVREATTRAGLVFLEDEGIGSEPTADLVDRALIVAELLEHDRYHVETVMVAVEFMVYAANDRGDRVDAAAVQAARHKTRTVRVDSIVDGGPYQPLRVYLVELASDDDSARVAHASDRRDWPDELQIAVAAGHVCPVLRIDFHAGDEPFEETVDGLERFRSGLLAAIS
jgi:hypothetical protein